MKALKVHEEQRSASVTIFTGRASVADLNAGAVTLRCNRGNNFKLNVITLIAGQPVDTATGTIEVLAGFKGQMQQVPEGSVDLSQCGPVKPAYTKPARWGEATDFIMISKDADSADISGCDEVLFSVEAY